MIAEMENGNFAMGSFRVCSHPLQSNIIAFCGSSSKKKLQKISMYDFFLETLIWDRTLPEKYPIGSVCFSPDGKELAVGNQNGQLYIYDLSWKKNGFKTNANGDGDGELSFYHTWGAVESIYCIKYSKNNHCMVCSTWSGKIMFLQRSSMQEVKWTITEICGDHLKDSCFMPIQSMCFYDHDRRLATADDMGYVRFWNLESKQCDFYCHVSNDVVRSLDIYDHNMTVGMWNGSFIIFYDIHDQNDRQNHIANQELRDISSFSMVKFLWSGSYILTVTRNGKICLYETSSRKKKAEYRSPITVTSCSLSCCESFLFITNEKRACVFILAPPTLSLDHGLEVSLTN